jgi:hypothetical protein
MWSQDEDRASNAEHLGMPNTTLSYLKHRYAYITFISPPYSKYRHHSLRP